MSDDPISFPRRDTWHLPTRHVGRTVTVYSDTDSTNSRAAALAGQPGSDGAAILADRQSAGRGQHGRSWLAPPRSSVLLSLLVYPPADLSRPVLLTAWVAVSVRAVVEALTGGPARIKWPNDILVGGGKVCGILIEQAARGGQTAVVAGIGLNVAQTAEDFGRAGLPDATSLRRITGRPFDPDAVARALIEQLDEGYETLLHHPDALAARWAAGVGLVGEEVVAEVAGGERRGRLVGMSFAGLTLDRTGRPPLTVAPETVLHLRHA
jgi:BirA family biotin operon repressor/biotin-[acetyl-CoA-carboxylase] ligase